MIIQHADKKYTVIKELGKGHSGQVYLALNPEGSAVAVKCLIRSVNEGTLERFRREFNTLRSLVHPHVAQSLDFGFDEAQGQYFFVTEYIRGSSLDLALQNADSKTALKFFAQALKALSYLHREGVFHCDLKPQNILVTEEGEVKVIDFDVATRGGAVLGGTPACFAPELLVDLKRIPDARSDLFSLGATFYQSLTRLKPFPGNTFEEVKQSHRTVLPPLPSAVNPSLDPAWDGLLPGLIQVNPSRRFSTASAVLQQVLPLLGEKVSLLSPEEIFYRLSQPGLPIGKDDVIQEAKTFLKLKFEKDEAVGRLWILKGESGAGLSFLLEELGLLAQLHGLNCFRWNRFRQSEPNDFPFVWMVDDVSELLRPEGEEGSRFVSRLKEILHRAEGQRWWVVLGGLRENDLPEQVIPMEAVWIRQMKIPLWSEKETKAWLKDVFQTEVPPFLVDRVQEQGGGNPKKSAQALQGFLEKGLVLGQAGQWRKDLLDPTPVFLESFLKHRFPEQAHPRSDLFRSAEEWAQLGDEAARRGLWQSAEEHYNRAYQGTDPHDLKKRLEYAVQRGKSLVGKNELNQARTFFTGLLDEFSAVSASSPRFLAKIHERLGVVESRQGNLSASRRHFEEGLGLLMPKRDPLDQYLALKNFLAGLDLVEGRIESAVRSFKESHEEAESLPWEKRRILTNNDLGAALLSAGRFEEAIAHWTHILKDFEIREDKNPLARCHYQMAQAYLDRGLKTQAMSHLLSAEQASVSTQNFEMELRICNALANLLQEKAPDKALQMFEKALSAAFHTSDLFSTGAVLLNMGSLLLTSQEPARALHTLHQAKVYLSNCPAAPGSSALFHSVHLEISKAAAHLLKAEEALKHGREALEWVEKDLNLEGKRFDTLLGHWQALVVSGQAEEAAAVRRTLSEMAKSSSAQEALARQEAMNLALLQERDQRSGRFLGGMRSLVHESETTLIVPSKESEKP